jgi:hypothetical protein
MDAAYLVVASRDGQTELWAAAGTPGKALAEVRGYLPSGWMLTLTGETLSSEDAATLDIRPGDVRWLRGGLSNNDKQFERHG